NELAYRFGRFQRLLVDIDATRHRVVLAQHVAQTANAQLPGALEGVILAARGPQGRMRLLHRLRDNFPLWYVKILALVRVDLLRPDVGEHGQGLFPDASGVFEVDPEGRDLIGVPRAAHAHIDTATAEDVESGSLRRDVQGMVHRQQDDAEAQAH